MRVEKSIIAKQFICSFSKAVWWSLKRPQSLKKDELSTPESFDVRDRLQQKLIQAKNDLIFGSKTALELQKSVTRKGQPV